MDGHSYIGVIIHAIKLALKDIGPSGRGRTIMRQVAVIVLAASAFMVWINAFSEMMKDAQTSVVTAGNGTAPVAAPSGQGDRRTGSSKGQPAHPSPVIAAPVQKLPPSRAAGTPAAPPAPRIKPDFRVYFDGDNPDQPSRYCESDSGCDVLGRRDGPAKAEAPPRAVLKLARQARRVVAIGVWSPTTESEEVALGRAVALCGQLHDWVPTTNCNIDSRQDYEGDGGRSKPSRVELFFNAR